MQLGNKIKQLRAIKGLTQEELAEKLFVSRQTVSNWENNKSFPNIDYIESISATFNVSIDELITSNEETAEIDELSKQEIIQINKERVILNRLLYYRLLSVYAGTLIASYFFFSKRHLDYIWAPLVVLAFGLVLSLPIKWIRNKYELHKKEDLVRFLDELYS